MELEIGTERVVRCPDWDECEVTDCPHKKLHIPDIDCFTKSPGSIRPEVCPDCKVESK